jgi:hypothetical protein
MLRWMNRRNAAAYGLLGAVLLGGILACNGTDDAPPTGPDAATSGGGGATGGSAANAGGTSAGAGGSRGDGGEQADTGGVAGTGGVSATGGSVGAAAGGSGGTRPDAGSDGSSGGSTASADSVWAPLSVMAIVNPRDHGAVGNGTTDDQTALTATVNALPAAGGIVYLPEGATFKKTNVLLVTKSHVKWWAPNGQATLFQSVAGQKRHQSVLCRNGTGCGFFGVKFTSDAAARFDALEDNAISADHARLVEVAGCDIGGAAAVGVMLYGSTEQYIEGNYVHHTWADHIHHTYGATQSWVWGNFIFNEAPSKGDDGVACVTYGPASPRCGSMEWWKNTILGTGWGRGYSVIGGNDISIHDNWAIGVAGAGVIVASEGSYDSASSSRIQILHNAVYQCGQVIGHPGILVSGENTNAEPISNVTIDGNVSTGDPNGGYRAEGSYTAVTNTHFSEAASALPQPIPTRADVRTADTAVLRTRDVSHVDAAFRAGLYRIHVRRNAGHDGFEQRFEYVVKGPTAAVEAFVAARTQANDYVSEKRASGDTTRALVLTRAPLTIPSGLTGVPFTDLRAGDTSGELAWLWKRVDSGSY